MTILLVEDSKFLRMANERMLAKAGYKVISAGDGETALRVARQRIPDLILLDMMIPKLDGLGVLRALKRDPQTRGIPVIVITALSQKNDAKLKKEGSTAYIVKSDSLLENNGAALLQAVESLVGKPETRVHLDDTCAHPPSATLVTKG